MALHLDPLNGRRRHAWSRSHRTPRIWSTRDAVRSSRCAPPRESPDCQGELSRFHETFGYYAHGVDETTATLPEGWEQRLIGVRNENTGWATGWCLELHDLARSKLVAGRERDVDFVGVLVRERLVDLDTLDARLRSLPVESSRIETLQTTLRRLAGSAR